ncbi:hypothetical protein HOK31_18170, partial [Candidatus Poribacteria bacterium]|nr:hypothetical protein [Candidatus Poribacteria bacterium]
MQVTMRYGRDGRVVQFPDPNTTVLRMRPSVPVADPVRAVADALVNPIGAAYTGDVLKLKTTKSSSIAFRFVNYEAASTQVFFINRDGQAVATKMA